MRSYQQLQALAQEIRLRMFKTLINAGPEGIAAGKLCKILSVSCNALSFHLSQLTEVGLIQSRREGRYIIYSANYQAADKLVNYLIVIVVTIKIINNDITLSLNSTLLLTMFIRNRC